MKKIALLGMPNSGKSTFFNSISGASAKTGNWSGMTVDIQSVKTLVQGELVELIDLPGIYTLDAKSEDEIIVQNFLKKNSINEIYFILNSTQIDRHILLASKLIKLGFNLKILCNMSDEAKKLGIEINYKKLENRLQSPVYSISAKFKKGYEFLNTPANTSNIIKNFKPLKEDEINSYVKFPELLNDKLSSKLDKIFLNRYLGLPLFFVLLYGLFRIIYGISEPIQDFFGQCFDFLGAIIQSHLFEWVPRLLASFLYDGIFLGVTTVLTFIPVIIIFFIVMSLIENSGYFSRAAFVMDKIMEKMGLDGRSFVMILFGFGCNVPAIMGTKIMRSKSVRFLTMLVIPFSLCSARLQVFLFFTAIFFNPSNGALILFSMYLISFATIFITAVVFRKKNLAYEPLIIEIPPYRLPSLRQTLNRAFFEVKLFFKRASKFIIFGVIMVWLMTNFYLPIDGYTHISISDLIGSFLSPIFDPIGINDKLIIALLFGFIAKEILIGALSVIFASNIESLSEILSAQITWQQALSFMIFTLIYTPCVSTLAAIKSESKNLKLTLISFFWSLILAWLLSFVAYQLLIKVVA